VDESAVELRVRAIVEGLAERHVPGLDVPEPFGEGSVWEEIDDLLSETDLSPEEACDAFAAELAAGFGDSRLSYDLCDAVVNALFAWITTDKDHRTIPASFWEVFNAFDEGEYRHPGDADDVDPSEKYTRTQIRDFLSRTRTG